MRQSQFLPIGLGLALVALLSIASSLTQGYTLSAPLRSVNPSTRVVAPRFHACAPSAGRVPAMFPERSWTPARHQQSRGFFSRLHAESPEAPVEESFSEPVATASVGFQTGDLVLAQYSEDELWYNAEVKEILEPGQRYVVEFSDYGNMEERDSTQVKQDDGTGEKWEYVEPQIGEVYDGEVVGVRDFGIFVNFGAERDGMVHISQIVPWRVENPADIVTPGQPVRVRLLDIRDDGKLQLSMKGLNPEIQRSNTMSGPMPEEGGVYMGKVVQIRPFGAFVNFGFARDGLVHVSQMADYHVSDPEDVVALGDKVKVLVQSVEDSGRIALTLKGEGLGVVDE